MNTHYERLRDWKLGADNSDPSYTAANESFAKDVEALITDYEQLTQWKTNAAQQKELSLIDELRDFISSAGNRGIFLGRLKRLVDEFAPVPSVVTHAIELREGEVYWVRRKGTKGKGFLYFKEPLCLCLQDDREYYISTSGKDGDWFTGVYEALLFTGPGWPE